ncbi:MAG TPA: TetR/AcrR family transcriptional regulator [Xanthobacteraceae bacterium]|jgi:AcrR family transcriptional regulator
MRRANVQRQSDRRLEILDAAQRCFARSGFHGASMQEICAEAAMSPGNLYRYFPSKEVLIAGICERNRAEAADSLLTVDQAPGFFEGLAALARHHLVERPEEEAGLCAEIMAESRRNPEIARLHTELEQDIKTRLIEMLRRAASRGEISSAADLDAAATMLMVLSDGLSWRRACDPSFKAEAMLPHVMNMVECLLMHPPAASPSLPHLRERVGKKEKEGSGQ